jgi:formylglycine-generating enzyme required for sulfatase activity
MLAVAGGSFWMGSPAGRGAADERPRHKLEIAEFCLDAREVTAGEYRACVKNTICAPAAMEPTQQLPAAAARDRLCTGGGQEAELPINCVSHVDAAQYCAWKGARLPSEAEWEWAATGGADALDHPWGAQPPRDDVVCWQAKRPCFVGSKPAEAFGIFDLGGNVAEWTSTVYGKYTEPLPSQGKLVVRGGSFEETQSDAMRPRRRQARAPSYRDVTLGFRCAKDL